MDHVSDDSNRDVKPHNFLVFSGARLKLTDFGSAAAIADDGQMRTRNSHQQPIPLSQCIIPVGTPDYIAPEVLEVAEAATVEAIKFDGVSAGSTAKRNPLDEINLDCQPGYGAGVDWWSYGACLYELAHGTAPFLTPTVRETYERILKCSVSLRLTGSIVWSDPTGRQCRTAVQTTRQPRPEVAAKKVSPGPD